MSSRRTVSRNSDPSALGLAEDDGDTDALAELLGDVLALAEAEADTDADGLTLAEGEPRIATAVKKAINE